MARVSQGLLNDVGDVILPKQVVTPDGRVFKMKRKDLMEDGRSQNMKMDGDKDGGGKNFEKKDEKVNKNRADDKLDEHDLEALSQNERDALFKRGAERGIYGGQRIRMKDKSKDLELDRVDTKNKVIIEDKEAKNFNRNPRGTDVAIDNWTQKNIYDNAKKKIDFITSKADHTYFNEKDLLSSPYSPDLSEIKEIKTIKYKLRSSKDAYEGKLASKIDEVIEQLSKEHPDWKFKIEYK